LQRFAGGENSVSSYSGLTRSAARKVVVIVLVSGYNGLGVITVAVAREHVKALIDRLTDEQVQALWVILESIAWPTEEITPEEAAELEEARAEIKAGKGAKAEDVWRELGI